ncbi:MAG: DUF494 family protein [Bacteroidetes bacterium]|nr:DUF494 family protein [Bacteroidota bacterium]MBU1678400.1 DUF494 family protein [Bacteroidota bacterium]MBU2508494.1 DUF494 family protein [Bacteroidota bacterium]
MTAKIVEAIAKILDGINKNLTLEEVNSRLNKDKSFDKQTVSAAFSLVYDKVLSGRIETKKAKKEVRKPFRFLTNEEKEILGQENCNYLLHLYTIGLIDSDDFESVLEQIMIFPEETISKEDINWIILVSIVDINSKFLPGSRVLLYSSDNIN